MLVLPFMLAFMFMLPFILAFMLMFLLPMLELDMLMFEFDMLEFDEPILELDPVFELVVVIVVLVFVLVVVVLAFSPPPQPVQKAATARRAKRAKVLRIEFFSCDPKGQSVGNYAERFCATLRLQATTSAQSKVKPLSRTLGQSILRQRVRARRHVEFTNDYARRLVH